MVFKNSLKILFVSIFIFAIGLLWTGDTNAQCTTTTSIQCCYGACASGYDQVSQHAQGAVRCCATGADSCDSSESGYCDCLKDNCSPSSNPDCDNCVWCREECTCCCSCPSPTCPSGTSGNNTGNACRVGPVNSLCQGVCNHTYCLIPSCQSSAPGCWIPENNPAPGSPTSIDMKVERRDGSHGSDSLQTTAYRVSYPRDGKLYDFRASGPPNNPRSSDPYNGTTFHTFPWQTPQSACNNNHCCSSVTLQGNFAQAYGQMPSLSYRYSFNGGSWSSLQGVWHWFRPNVTLSQGQTYTIRAQAYSANRCNGDTAGGQYQASFKVNYKPEVLSIVPIAYPSGNSWGDNPNLGVSGNMSWDASKFSINSETNDIFDCTIDNPKYFKVTFRDKDGCSDIDPNAAIPNDTLAGFRTSRQLGIRAVDKSGNTSNDRNGSLLPQEIKCVGGDRLEAIFSITFTGAHNIHYEIQAAARDVLGNRTYQGATGDYWVKGLDWYYDGLRPGLAAGEPFSIVVKEITGAAELLLRWEAKDFQNDLSGIRFVRTYARLDMGSILTGHSDYGAITYDIGGANKTVDVTNPFGRHYLLANELALTVQQARNQRANTHDGEKLLNIGKNQDGKFTFDVVAVDRACNFNRIPVEQTLGTPWVATRGGFVYSRGNIKLDTRPVDYTNINITHPPLETAEMTTLSTEWLASGGSVNPNDKNPYHYLSEGYSSAIGSGLYSDFMDLAQRRDPDKEMWGVLSGGHIDSSILNANCRDDSKVYFINSTLQVNPLHYQNLGKDPGKGCVFIVNGDINIGAGEHKSAGADSPRYDLIRGFFIAEGEIHIEFVDQNKNVRDGLKVVGSLIALDNPSGKSSVRLRRSLQLKDNLLHPTLIIFHDPRYMDIARHVIGETIGGGYIRDVGFVE